MINRKRFSAIFAGIIFIALCSVALAQGPMGPRGQMGAGARMQGRGQGPAANLLRMKEYLGLTDQQVNDMKAIVEKHKGTLQPLALQAKEKRQALKAALDAAEPNATTVGQLVIAERAIGKQIRALNEKFRDDLLAVLTEEQKDKLLERGFMRGPRRPR